MIKTAANNCCYAFLMATCLLTLCHISFSQEQTPRDRQKVRTVTVPISIYTKKELATDKADEFVQADRLIVREDKEEQTILSIRSVASTPLAIQVLIQDDLNGTFNLQIKDVAEFIRELPKGSRVMVAYIRGGSLEIRQRFTEDLDKAASSLRIVPGSSITSSSSPFDTVGDALGRFDGLPTGRRAVLLFSDGLDPSAGLTGFGPSQSVELERAITRAQRRSIAVYSFYNPTALTGSSDPRIGLAAQGALSRLADETGGRAFYQGTSGPITFKPFFNDLRLLLNRQFALTYLSTHMKRGYHRVEIMSTNPEIKIEHPRGYYYR